MRAVVQRVTKASVSVEGKVTGLIEKGLMVLIGVAEDDTDSDVVYMADKIVNLRIFEDEEGKMNRSVAETGGSVLAVSQFTLFGDVRKGRRPSFIEAARPEKARALYQALVEKIRNQNIGVEEGVFQADMLVSLDNDGPVTILLDSKKLF